MSIKLIASDMDGTLLDPYSNISDANVQAILRAQEEGVEFIISSGREYRDAKEKLESRGITCGYICLSGAAVYDETGKRLADLPLTQDNLADAGRILTEYKTGMDLLTSADRYTTIDKETKLSRFYSFLNGWKPCLKPLTEDMKAKADAYCKSTRFITSIWQVPDDVEVYKICADDLPEETVRELKEVFKQYPSLAAASSFPTNIEITNVNAQKGYALKTYAKEKGISAEDIMVIGDSDNDLSMFQSGFGWTVAMENSMDCIRDAARYHTRSNTEDGVAWAIETYVFNRA